MYLPFLRGKQFELVALRELASEIESQYLRPIIEPVRRNLTPLVKTISCLNDNNIEPILIINPSVGEFSYDDQQGEKGGDVVDLLSESGGINFLPCVILADSKDTKNIDITKQLGRPHAIMISGGVDKGIIELSKSAELTIVNENIPPLALKKLTNAVLIGDFFDKQVRNSDYKLESVFSHLHATYNEYSNTLGFSDYTIMPRTFSEGGGPAYVVTIHASYVNEDKFDEMYVRHYSSYDDESPTDPAGKFADALGKLVFDAEDDNSIFYSTSAIAEFIKFNESKHFPGLGQVKKISIKHHIETTCKYLETNSNV